MLATLCLIDWDQGCGWFCCLAWIAVLRALHVMASLQPYHTQCMQVLAVLSMHDGRLAAAALGVLSYCVPFALHQAAFMHHAQHLRSTYAALVQACMYVLLVAR